MNDEQEISFILKDDIDLIDVVRFRKNDIEKHIKSGKYMFLDINEMTNDIIENRIDEDFKEEIKNCENEELIKYHFNFGMWIRNTYGLWLESNPNVEMGDMGDNHPDGVSMKVIEKIHKKLT